jgi:hypothetical protein
MNDIIKKTKKVKKIIPTYEIKRMVDRFFDSLVIGGSDNSCGQSYVDDLQISWRNYIEHELTPSNEKQVLEYLQYSFRKQLHRKLKNLEGYSPDERNLVAFHNISLNEKADKRLCKVLDKVCASKTKWKNNPNHDHNIKVWII